MELQFHPGSGRTTVSGISLGGLAQRALVVALSLAVLLAVSLWFTAPVVLRRTLTAQEHGREAAPRTVLAAAAREMEKAARSLRARSLAHGDLLNRIALLYGIRAADWPRALDPDRDPPGDRDPARMLEGLRAYLAALDRGLTILAAREAVSPDLAARCPSRLPLATADVAPAVFFGPGVSPWTGKEEFARGVDLAAPPGAAVLAPGDGTVLFAGRLPRLSGRRLWQLGNLVVVSHGPAGATLYGHLSRIEVRRGDRVRRGRRIGTVGRSGWAPSPRLHYELWRGEGGRLGPTDPLFSMLDRPFDSPSRSLPEMLATSAPGALEPLPGGASR